MAEDNEIVVNEPTSNLKPYPYKPLQAGLMATLAAAPSGPLAPLIGLATGLFVRHRRNQYNDRQAAYLDTMRNEHQSMMDAFNSEIEKADPDERRKLEIAQRIASAGYARLAGGDESGNEMVQKAFEIMTGITQGDIDARKQEEKAAHDMDRSLFTTSVNAYRSELQNTLDNASAINTQADKILELTSLPDFDPNKPINRTFLADLASLGSQMFRDTPDLADAAMAGGNALGATGAGVVAGLATLIKSEDYHITKEDFNRLAINMKKAAQEAAKRKMEQLGSQTQQLETWGKKRRIIDGDYSLSQYITGGEKELRLTPVPNYPEHHEDDKTISLEESLQHNHGQPLTINPALGAKKWNEKHGKIKRPTN